MTTGAVTDTAAQASEAAFAVENVTKAFPGQLALDDVSVTIRAGEVHALLGQNGSGKSTLIKILAGYHRADAGRVQKAGDDPVDLTSGDGLRELPLRFIHQDLGLVPGLSTLDNLALGRGFHTRHGRIAWQAEAQRARRLLAGFGLAVDVFAPVSTLTADERAIVAIIRALQDWTEGEWTLLVLDEPTASLSAREVDRLFEAVRVVAERGASVLFVSHRLDEVFAIADRVSVLRNGRLVATRSVADLSHESLVELIVGRPIDDLYSPPPPPGTNVALAVEAVAGRSVTEASFVARRGEIVGVAGLVGSGRDEIVPLLFGALPREAGSVRVGSTEVEPGHPQLAIAAGIGMVPRNRADQGALLGFSVSENLTLPSLRPLVRWGRIAGGRERAEVEAWMDRVDVRPRDARKKVGELSGGNQQKVVLAKWLRIEPAVLLLDEPTQGVDVGAKAQIYKLLADSAAAGTAIVVASSDNEELVHICDRVLVFRGGRIGAEVSGAGLSEERLLAESLAIAAQDGSS